MREKEDLCGLECWMMAAGRRLGTEREDVISPWNSLGRTLQEDLLSLWIEEPEEKNRTQPS